MKKRILAMLLLLAMILTMVPVIASADEVSANAEGGENAVADAAEGAAIGDLHEWYVQNGLPSTLTTTTSQGLKKRGMGAAVLATPREITRRCSWTPLVYFGNKC